MNTPRAYIKYINNGPNTIVDKQQLLPLLKNNQVSELLLYNYIDNDDYSELFELLKTNTSVHALTFGHMYSNITNHIIYKLLYDMLKVNMSLQILTLMYNNITIKDAKLLCKTLKNNTLLTRVRFHYDIISNNIFENLIKTLKFNKTITHFYMDSHSQNIINGANIVNELINNPYVTYLSGCNCLSSNIEIQNYCARNKHNIMLRSLMIQDL
jgi:hypothetical protein